MRRLQHMAAGLALAATSLQAASAVGGEFKRFHRHVGIDETLQERAGNGAGVRVGVIDTDIDVDHPEFEDRVVEVIRDPDHPYQNPGNHGTQVAGIVAAARDGRGMVGIAPGGGDRLDVAPGPERRRLDSRSGRQSRHLAPPGIPGNRTRENASERRQRHQRIPRSRPRRLCSTGLSSTCRRSRRPGAKRSSRSRQATMVKISRT